MFYQFAVYLPLLGETTYTAPSVEMINADISVFDQQQYDELVLRERQAFFDQAGSLLYHNDYKIFQLTNKTVLVMQLFGNFTCYDQLVDVRTETLSCIDVASCSTRIANAACLKGE